MTDESATDILLNEGSNHEVDPYQFSLRILNVADELVAEVDILLSPGPFQSPYEPLLNSHLALGKPLKDFSPIQEELIRIIELMEQGEVDSEASFWVQRWTNTLKSIGLPDDFIPIFQDIFGEQEDVVGIDPIPEDLGVLANEDTTDTVQVNSAVVQEADSLAEDTQVDGVEEGTREELADLTFEGHRSITELKRLLIIDDVFMELTPADSKILRILAGFELGAAIPLERLATELNISDPDLTHLIELGVVVKVSEGVYQIHQDSISRDQQELETEVEAATPGYQVLVEESMLIGPRGRASIKDPFLLTRLQEAPGKNGIIEFHLKEMHNQGSIHTTTGSAKGELVKILRHVGLGFESSPNGRELGWVSIQINDLTNS